MANAGVNSTRILIFDSLSHRWMRSSRNGWDGLNMLREEREAQSFSNTQS
jgi:hypothetical protein